MFVKSASAQLLATPWVAAVLVVTYAALASLLRPLSWAAAAAIVVPAALIGGHAMLRHQADDVPEVDATRQGVTQRAVKLWSVLLLAGLLWEAWAFFHQPAWDVASYDHPTLSTLIGPALENPAVRIGALTLWLYAGIRLARP